MIFAKPDKNSIALFHLGLCIVGLRRPGHIRQCSVAPLLVKTGFFSSALELLALRAPITVIKRVIKSRKFEKKNFPKNPIIFLLFFIF